MSKFKYRGRTTEDVQRRAKQSSGRYDSYVSEEVTWFKPRAGENCIRLIPWLDQGCSDFDKMDERWGNHWGIDIILHRNVGPDNGTYLCLDKMKGEPCPICDAWRSDGIEGLKPADRVLCWLIDRNDEKAGPQLWAMPLGVSKDISAVSQDKSSKALLLIDNWEEGYDVFFDREGELKHTQYKRVSLDRAPTPLLDDKKKQDEWLAYVFAARLPDILKYYESDYLEKVLSGQTAPRDEADGDDRGGRRRREEPADEREDNSSRTRSRSRDPDETVEDTPPPRSRRADPDDDSREERSTRRRVADDEDKPRDEPEARTSRRRAEPEPEDEDEVATARGRLREVGQGRRR